MLQQDDVRPLTFESGIKAKRVVCDFCDRACYFDATKSPANDHEVEQSPSPRGVRLDRRLFESRYHIVAEIDRISQGLDRVCIRRKTRHHIHVHYRTACQYQVIIRKRRVFATLADVAHEMGLQVDVGDLRRQPRRAAHHLAPCDRHVQRRDRTPDHFGKHRRECEMILAADENDLGLGRNFSLEVLCECHTAESASHDYYPLFTHVRLPPVYISCLRPELFQIRPVPSNNRAAPVATGDWLQLALIAIPGHRT